MWHCISGIRITISNEISPVDSIGGLVFENVLFSLQDGEHNADFDNDVLFGDYDDEIEKLSPEEKKEKLRNLVEKKIDANRDGWVNVL